MPEFQDLFVSGRETYHTFRIPALTVTTAGTVLAFAEGRRNGPSDTGDIDLVVRRSTDRGLTFGELQAVVEGGGDVAGNPAPVVDRDTGRIWLPFCRNNADGPEELICAGKAPRTVWVTFSDDDGATWASPRELTADVKDPAWTWYATGPCHAIQLRSGRLLVPCNHSVGVNFNLDDPFHSHVIHSDDHGATWQLGGSTPAGTDESVVAELDDGSIYVNARCVRREDERANRRGFVRSWDGGASYSEVGWHGELVDPYCQGSVVRAGEAGAPLVFSNAASLVRERLTVRTSRDGGRTWSGGHVLHAGPAAYSDLCTLPDGGVGCLFECGDVRPYERLRWVRLTAATLELEQGHRRAEWPTSSTRAGSCRCLFAP